MVATGINYFSNYQTFEIEGKKVQPNTSVMITGSHNPSEYNGFKITFDKKPFFGEDVITSYSIHYTKLYDQPVFYSKFHSLKTSKLHLLEYLTHV